MLSFVPSGLLTRITSLDHPTWRAAVLAGCVASVSLGCGGKSNSDVFNDGGSGGSSVDGSGGTATGGTGSGPNGTGTGTQGTGSSIGGSGGSSGGGTSSTSSGGSGTSGGGSGGSTGGGNGNSTNTTVSTSTTGTGTTGSGGGPPDDRCLLPLDGGDCDAAFQRFGYNVETGRCEEFIYGGCGGNENRFESLEECLAACDPDARTACEITPDCVIDHGCCGFCDIDSPDDLVAVNMKYASFNDTECQLVDCAYCPPPESIGNFGARCNDGTCEIYDVRKSDLSACETDADCRLRAGLGCCEACGDTNWVAVSSDYELLQKELCSGLSGGCLACAPDAPPSMFAGCGADGHCQIEMLLP